MTVWVLPIEPLEERYSAQWLTWWRRECQGQDVVFILGEGAESIEIGEFLDAIATHTYKATQLSRFIARLQAGEVKSSDTVLLHDGWSWQVTALAYMRDCGPVHFRIAGLFHAGTWDPWDHLTQRGMGKWAAMVEQGWLEALDLVLVSTEFHARLLSQSRPTTTPIRVVGLPFYRHDLPSSNRPWSDREQLVVFPHRLAPEKQPQVFEQLADAYRSRYGGAVEWVRTRDVYDGKPGYYDLLGRARVSFSSALQETFGIAMVESTAMGAWPVAPLRLAYPETLQGFTLYSSLSQAVELVHAALTSDQGPPCYQRWQDWESHIDRVLDLVHDLASSSAAGMVSTTRQARR